jgi:hypothetical protein
MIVREIPLLGRALAGKTQILRRLAEAYGRRVEGATFPLRTDDLFDGHPVTALLLDLPAAAGEITLWCLPGGSAPEWVLPFLPPDCGALVAIDPQADVQESQAEWMETQLRAVDPSRCAVVMTKRNLASTETAIPSPLAACPFVYLDTNDPSSAAMLRDHIEAFAARLTNQVAMPIRERLVARPPRRTLGVMRKLNDWCRRELAKFGL